MASIPEHEYEYNRTYSIYGNLTKMIEFYHGGRGFLTNEDTVRKLLWLIKERTGINYVPESAVVDVHAKSYSEGYETGRVETRRAYEGKRYTEAEMDKHGQLKYQEGYNSGISTQCVDDLIEEQARLVKQLKSSNEDCAHLRRVISDFQSDAVKMNGELNKAKEDIEHLELMSKYNAGVEEGHRQYDWLRKQAEAKYKDLKVKYDKLEQELKAIERCADTAYDKGYLKGCQEAEEKCAAQRQLRYQQGFEDGAKGKEKFATDRAEESYKKGHSQGIKDAWQKFDQGTTWEDGYQQGKRDADAKHQVLTAKAERRAHDAGFADGYAKGKQQGKKEVVDFINNMKVSQ